MCWSFLEVYIIYLCNHLSEIIHTWTIGTQKGPCRGWKRSLSRTSFKSSISVLEFSRSLYLCNHLSESIHSWTKGTLPNPTLPYHTQPYPTLPYHTLPYHTLPYPTLPLHTYPTYPTLPIPLLPYPALPYPTLPIPPLTYHTLTLALTLPPPIALYPTLPYPTLPYPTLHYPTRPYPTLPYPTLPYPTEPYYPLRIKHVHITKQVAVELRCYATALITCLPAADGCWSAYNVPGSFSRKMQNFNPFHRIFTPLRGGVRGVSGLVKTKPRLYCSSSNKLVLSTTKAAKYDRCLRWTWVHKVGKLLRPFTFPQIGQCLPWASHSLQVQPYCAILFQMTCRYGVHL